jgi:glycosyltransferase involved in cell wall biosynthesis
MRIKKIGHKARLGARILKNEGALSLSIKSLQKVQSLTQKKAHKSSRKHKLNIRVKYQDVLSANLSRGIPTWSGTNKTQLAFNWLMPPPGMGSGGHINIFRFIKFLEDAGHTCRIYIYSDGGGGALDAIHKIINGSSYPRVQAEIYWLNDDAEMENAEGIFSTSWETAYASYNSKLTSKRFYFVQDFEPYFYAIGSMYALAENTYKFGFHGVTAGGWLSTKLKRDYGMDTDHFDFGSDGSLYSFDNASKRKEIFFYARPYTERRGFEMGVMALDIFHKKHPDYTINFAGWDVSEYDIPFPYNNLKTLEVDKLNKLYNNCAAGLVMSFTNMSLLPLELLGSGTIPVVNDAENNRLVSNNPYIAYCRADPVSLANKLSEIVSKANLPNYAKKASQSVIENNWQDSGNKFVSIVEKATRVHE